MFVSPRGWSDVVAPVEFMFIAVAWKSGWCSVRRMLPLVKVCLSFVRVSLDGVGWRQLADIGGRSLNRFSTLNFNTRGSSGGQNLP